jgi:hypothetical protein
MASRDTQWTASVEGSASGPRPRIVVTGVRSLRGVAQVRVGRRSGHPVEATRLKSAAGSRRAHLGRSSCPVAGRASALPGSCMPGPSRCHRKTEPQPSLAPERARAAAPSAPQRSQTPSLGGRDQNDISRRSSAGCVAVRPAVQWYRQDAQISADAQTPFRWASARPGPPRSATSDRPGQISSTAGSGGSLAWVTLPCPKLAALTNRRLAGKAL